MLSAREAALAYWPVRALQALPTQTAA